MKKQYQTHAAAETQALATEVLKNLQGNVITLQGDLGVGKTTFTQGLAKVLGIKQHILSPTFIIMRTYQQLDNLFGIKQLYHVDLYRLTHEQEIVDLGLMDMMADPENLIVIEWAEKMGSLLPTKRTEISLTALDEQTRDITIETYA